MASDTKPVRAKPLKVLPTARISTSKQLDVLRGYAAASGPGNKAVTIEEVADIVKIAPSSLPLINPFLMDVGLLQKVEQKGEAWKYLPSQDVINFGKAYEWNRDTAAQKLAPTISSSWFAVALLSKLSFAPIEENEAVTTACGQGRCESGLSRPARSPAGLYGSHWVGSARERKRPCGQSGRYTCIN